MDMLLAKVEGMANQMTSVVSRVAKLENPRGTSASAHRETRNRTVFIDDDEEEEDYDDEHPESPKLPVQDERVADRRAASKPAVERREDQIVVYIDSGTARWAAADEVSQAWSGRRKAAAAPMQRWDSILTKCAEITEVDCGGGVMTYSKLHTNIKHHRLALKYQHSILHIARCCTKESKVLGHCVNALIFLDQMMHNDGMQEVAEQLALFPERQINFEPLC